MKKTLGASRLHFFYTRLCRHAGRYNSQCDSETPMSARSIAREVERRERRKMQALMNTRTGMWPRLLLLPKCPSAEPSPCRVAACPNQLLLPMDRVPWVFMHESAM